MVALCWRHLEPIWDPPEGRHEALWAHVVIHWTCIHDPFVPKLLYLSVERRWNFSVDTVDVVAHGYARFRSYLTVLLPHPPRSTNGSSTGTGLPTVPVQPKAAGGSGRLNSSDLWLQGRGAREHCWDPRVVASPEAAAAAMRAAVAPVTASDAFSNDPSPKFKALQVDTALLPQYVDSYERSVDLEMWVIGVC